MNETPKTSAEPCDPQRRLAIQLPFLTLGAMTGVAARAADGGAPQALVIGNDAYRSGPKLANAVNDAKLIDRTLRTLGVDSSLIVNQTAEQLSQAIESFVRRIRATAPPVIWLFYSGHGASVEGRDLLLGTDASFTTPDSLVNDGYALGSLRSLLDQTRASAAIVVVDACRDNPFVATRGGAGSQPGLILREWAGSLTAYSTAPYTRALDWPDRPNGPYASALSKALLDRRARSIETVFMECSDSVYRMTNQRQKPGYYSDLRQPLLVAEGRVSLVVGPPPPTTLLEGADASRVVTTRSVAPRMYRTDLDLDDRYLGTRNEEWETQIERIEQASRLVDLQEATRLVAKAGRANASDHDRSLAGVILWQGRAVPEDRQRAARVLLVPARHGYVPAQVFLGELQYERQAYEESLRWLHEASATGMPRPLLSLAQLNLEGSGTPQDTAKGMTLLIESLKRTVDNNRAPSPP